MTTINITTNNGTEYTIDTAAPIKAGVGKDPAIPLAYQLAGVYEQHAANAAATGDRMADIIAEYASISANFGGRDLVKRRTRSEPAVD